MAFENWSDGGPGTPEFVQHPSDRSQWVSALTSYLGAGNDLPLLRCLDVALANGAVTLVIESRYIDLDYRSEYSSYFSRLFRSVPDTTHRIHFFSEHIEEEQIGALSGDSGYLGYVVVRPTYQGPVSRAMLRPPSDIEDAIRASVVERVNFFGQYLAVKGVPFTQQDTQLGACAHAAAWMCHFTAVLRGDVSRIPRADLIGLVDASMSLDRAVPTSGLNVGQLSELFRTAGLPSIFYRLGQLPSDRLPWQPSSATNPGPGPDGIEPPAGTWDHGVIPILSRYLNSGLPVLVGTHDHAFVICGYRRSMVRQGWIEFFRNDDQRGPYIEVEDVLSDRDQTPWRTLHVPAPEKIWLGPEAAEQAGGRLLVSGSVRLSSDVLDSAGAAVESLQTLIDEKRLALKTYVLKSNEFKANLTGRGIADEIVKSYRLSGLSRYVWVVEAVDRRLRNAGNPCVFGQAIFDCTSSDTDPYLIGFDVHGRVWTASTNAWIQASQVEPYSSGAIGPP